MSSVEKLTDFYIYFDIIFNRSRNHYLPQVQNTLYFASYEGQNIITCD